MRKCYDQSEVERAADRVVAAISRSIDVRSLIVTADMIRSSDMGGQSAFWWTPSGSLDHAVLHSLRSHVVAAETRFPGAGEVAIRAAVASASRWRMLKRAGAHHGDLASEMLTARDTACRMSQGRRRLKFEEADNIVKDSLPPSLKCRALEVIAGSSIGTSIVVRRSSGLTSALLRDEGARIRISSPPGVSSHPAVRDPRVVLVDGTIEGVSQLHSVLTDAAENGNHYLVICRDSARDVDQTISVNNARGTISVLLLHARLDDLSVASLEDVSAYTGADILVPHSAETLSSFAAKAPTISGSASVVGGSLMIKGSPSPKLSRHTEKLRTDAASGDQSVSDFISARLSGLAADRVEAHIGRADIDRDPVAFERADTGLRVLARCLASGASIPATVPKEVRSVVGDEAAAAAESQLVPGAGASGIVSGINFSLDLCTLGFAVC